jgi:hypothetical protein
LLLEPRNIFCNLFCAAPVHLTQVPEGIYYLAPCPGKKNMSFARNASEEHKPVTRLAENYGYQAFRLSLWLHSLTGQQIA